jgi:hypothetical protein
MVGQTGTKDRAPSSARAESDAEGELSAFVFYDVSSIDNIA